MQALQDWMVTHSWDSPAHYRVQDTERFNKFWGYGSPPYDGWARVSWIDHILLYGPSIIHGSAVTLGLGPPWANISDHRPLSLWLTGPSLKISQTMSRLPKPLPSRLIKLNFKAKDEATLTLYRQQVHRRP